MDKLRTIAITGASGLIGRALCESLGSRGHSIRALIRRPDAALAALPNVATFTCDLPGRIDPVSLRGCDAVIHAAYVTRFRSVTEARETNEVGTRRIFEFSRKAGVPRFILVSTTSAHAAARSYYGTSKFRMEQMLDPARDLIIRPGLVISPLDNGGGGLLGRMARGKAGDRWTIPLFAGGRQPMQTIHIDDLCEGFRLAIESETTGALTLASPERGTTREFFAAVAAKFGRRPRFIPVPVLPAVVALRFAERLGIALPVSSDNLLGLLHLPYWDTEPDLRRIGLRVRPLQESLATLLTNQA